MMKVFVTGNILLLITMVLDAQPMAMKNSYPFLEYSYISVRFKSYVLIKNPSVWNYLKVINKSDFKDTISLQVPMLELVNGLLSQRLKSMYPDQQEPYYLTKILFYRNHLNEIIAWGNYRYIRSNEDRRYLDPNALGAWTGVFDAAPGDFRWFRIQLQFPYVITFW